ncbi:MAG TPA: response regulator [Nitrososphaeraceae archaeon]|jgi:two-component system, OmpR family, response regulator
MKILGIDDNTDINELLETVLNGSGHEFTYVNNGTKGLGLIREKKFDIVLLDVAMPEFSGFDVINSLLKEGLLTKQKIILFTASSVLDAEIEELVKKGIHSCIRKPVDVDFLLEKLEQLQV